MEFQTCGFNISLFFINKIDFILEGNFTHTIVVVVVVDPFIFAFFVINGTIFTRAYDLLL